MIDTESVTRQGGIIGPGALITCTLCVGGLAQGQAGQQGDAHISPDKMCKKFAFKEISEFFANL